MNCEWFDKDNERCRIDDGRCSAEHFCRLFGVEKPSDGVPFVEGAFRRITAGQSAKLTAAIKILLPKPALR